MRKALRSRDLYTTEENNVYTCDNPGISVPSKLRTSAVPPDNLRRAISFSRTSNILDLIGINIYKYRIALLTLGTLRWLCALHSCAVACASCAIKQTFAQCIIFLEGTLPGIHKYCQNLIEIALPPSSQYLQSPVPSIQNSSGPYTQQARNQPGTPGGAKSFLRGPKFLNYVQHIFPGGGRKKCYGGLSPLGLSAVCTFDIFLFRCRKSTVFKFMSNSTRVLGYHIIRREITIPVKLNIADLGTSVGKVYDSSNLAKKMKNLLRSAECVGALFERASERGGLTPLGFEKFS